MTTNDEFTFRRGQWSLVVTFPNAEDIAMWPDEVDRVQSIGDREALIIELVRRLQQLNAHESDDTLYGVRDVLMAAEERRIEVSLDDSFFIHELANFVLSELRFVRVTVQRNNVKDSR